tara:strand:+ start:3214 stop:3693 length:480 start_codon:yes stop_codon:yes gene_type:complete
MMRLIASFLRDRSGAAAAEMAMVTPLLIVIMFGCYEAGYYFWREHIVVKGVRDGARFAGRQAFSKYTCSTIDATTATQIKNLTRTGALSGGTARVPGWTDGQITITVSCDAATTTGIYTSQAGGAPRVTVSAVVTYEPLFGLLGLTQLAASANSPVMGI